MQVQARALQEAYRMCETDDPRRMRRVLNQLSPAQLAKLDAFHRRDKHADDGRDRCQLSS